jgi:thioredoxin reductase (NADPH)
VNALESSRRSTSSTRDPHVDHEADLTSSRFDESPLVDCEIAVVGGGPAGLTAALFAARHGRRTILLDPIGMGGSIMNTERVEDFPGFPEGMPGFELGTRIQEQVADAGGAFEMSEVRRIEPRGGDWGVVTDSRAITAGAVVVATGSRPRKLGVPREDEFEGKGLSHCASCDGPLYQGKVVAVCGAGDSALVEALELTGHDVRVVLIDVNEDLGAQETYGLRVRESAQVEIRHHTVVEEILGDGRVDGVRVRDLATGESSTLPVEGVFVHVGRIPNTELLDGVVALDEHGRVSTDAWMRTELPGLFAVGDVRADAAGQAISAAGDGATAAVAAHRYLAERAR